MLQISENVYGIMTKMQMLNYYIIKNGDTLTVIDIGLNAADVDTLEKAVTAHGWSMAQIQHILITHAHPDHIGGLPELQKRINAQTYVHRLDAPAMRGEVPSPTAKPEELGFFGRIMLKGVAGTQFAPSRVDTELHGGEVLVDVLPCLEVIPFPGHSYGQCGYWIPDQKLLIGGDVCMNLPWGVSTPLRPVSPDWKAALESIRKMADLEPEILCLGHGRIIKGNVRDKIAHLL